MAARYQHLSPAFLSDAVMLLDGALAEPKEAPEGESEEAPKDDEKGQSSGSSVTTASPAKRKQGRDKS